MSPFGHCRHDGNALLDNARGLTNTFEDDIGQIQKINLVDFEAIWKPPSRQSINGEKDIVGLGHLICHTRAVVADETSVGKP